ENLLDEAIDIVLDYDQQAWSKIFGHPHTIVRGDGHVFFQQPNGGVIGSHRLATLKSAAPIVCFRPEGTSTWFIIYSDRIAGFERELGRVLRVFACYLAH